MATTTTTAAPAATATSFGADDFATNFVSDLAPLLALFGDQATKQFLSVSTGWADNIMVAMGPLGILTIVVSAIRVSKLKWLKALIGRARESFAAAEVEVLSSTSEDVCERYNGNEIIRKEGETETKEFIYRTWTEAEGTMDVKPSDVGTRPIYENWVFDLREACSIGVMEFAGYLSKRKWHWRDIFPFRLNKTNPEAKGNGEEGPTIHANENREIRLETFERLEKTPPNITFHVPKALLPSWELWVFAVFGVSVQSAVLILSGITIYRWQIQKSGTTVSGYAYPCFLAGTITLSAGLLICARTIQDSTENTNFVQAKRSHTGVPDIASGENEMLSRARYKIARIQRCAEKEPNSWVILNSDDDGVLRTSRSRGPRYKQMSALGSFLAIIGYLAQYLGSRGLPWSTTIMQLVATVIMAAVRAYIRRGLANTPIAARVSLKNHELSWLARKICESGPWKTVSGSLKKSGEDTVPSDGVLPKQLKSVLNASKIVHRDIDYQIFTFSSKPVVRGLIDTHMRLQRLSTWTYPHADLVDNLVSAMTAVLKSYNESEGRKRIDEVRFDLPNMLFCNRGRDHDEREVTVLSVVVTLMDLNSGGEATKSQLGAILDFWTEGDSPDNKLDDSRSKKSSPKESFLKTRLEEINYNEESKNLRVIGCVIPHSRWTAKRANLLQDFIPQPVFRIPPSDGTHQYDPIFPAHGFSMEDNHTSAMTYGLLFSSMLRTRSMWAEGKRDAKSFKATMTVGSSNPATEGHRNKSNDDIEHPDLCVFSSNSVEVDCAHDIFSAFMLGVARIITKLGGRNDFRHEWTSTHGTDWRSWRGSRKLWSNSIIDQLAYAIKASGLVRDLEEAYILIVPALAAEDLLPLVTPPDVTSMSDWQGEANPPGEKLYNGFNLSPCETEIRRWFELSFNMQNFEKVMDFIVMPEDTPSTQDEDIATICNRTRAAMYLLRDFAIKNEKSPQRLDSPEESADSFERAMQGLGKAYKRMVPTIPLPGEEEVKERYNNLISDIRCIAEGRKLTRPWPRWMLA